MPAVSPDSSFNTAVSFASNTNWQGYGGESTMSYLTQMTALVVQNFVSAATGMAILIALIRGFVQKQMNTIGNFWVDLVRTILYILLPLSLVFAVLLVSQGGFRRRLTKAPRRDFCKPPKIAMASRSPNSRWPWGRWLPKLRSNS